MKAQIKKIISNKYRKRKYRNAYKKLKSRKSKIIQKKYLYILILFILYISFRCIKSPFNNVGENRFFVMFLYNNEAEMAYIHI